MQRHFGVVSPRPLFLHTVQIFSVVAGVGVVIAALVADDACAGEGLVPRHASCVVRRLNTKYTDACGDTLTYYEDTPQMRRR